MLANAAAAGPEEEVYTVLTSMDVIFKEGMLYLKAFKFGKRGWRKIWMVLFKASSMGVGRLEFYTVADRSSTSTDQKKAERKEKKVVRLSDCLSATLVSGKSCPPGCTAFLINTTQCSYTLASTCTQDWLTALCILAFQKDPGEASKGNFEEGCSLTMEDNDLYSSWESGSDSTLPANHFHVSVQSTEASKRCKLSGDYLLCPDTEAVMLLAINADTIIYCWPYRLLRKFGQIEGGFSIEAGRRCVSGEGVFTFLTQYGPEILQAISKQCAVEEKSSVQPARVHRGSISAVSLVAPTHRLPDPPSCSPANDESDCHYSTINVTSLHHVTQLSRLAGSSKDSVEEEIEEDWCYSLDALNLDNTEDCIYYNSRGAALLLNRKDPLDPGTADPECVYADVKKINPPSSLQLQLSFPSPPPPPPPPLFPPPPPPSMLSTAVPHVIPRPRNQLLPPVENCCQPGYNTQCLAVDDMKETEEAISSTARVAPTEAPGSFKHRLAEIISKDLAKLQPPLPYGAGSPAFSQ